MLESFICGLLLTFSFLCVLLLFVFVFLDHGVGDGDGRAVFLQNKRTFYSLFLTLSSNKGARKEKTKHNHGAKKTQIAKHGKGTANHLKTQTYTAYR